MKSKKIILLSTVIIILAGAIYILNLNSIYEEVPYQEFEELVNEGESTCLMSPFQPGSGNFVIETEEEYLSLIGENWNKQGFCEDFIPPSINFSEKSLLGQSARGSGCETIFKQRVFRDDSLKRIIYEVNVIEQGSCEPIRSSMNWILVSKIPTEYEVIFEIKN